MVKITASSQASYIWDFFFFFKVKYFSWSTVYQLCLWLCVCIVVVGLPNNMSLQAKVSSWQACLTVTVHIFFWGGGFHFVLTVCFSTTRRHTLFEEGLQAVRLKVAEKKEEVWNERSVVRPVFKSKSITRTDGALLLQTVCKFSRWKKKKKKNLMCDKLSWPGLFGWNKVCKFSGSYARLCP